MKFYSTKKVSPVVDIKTAVLQSLPSDNGLYMPETINQLPDTFWAYAYQYSFSQIALKVANCLLDGCIPYAELKQIVEEAVNFDAPLVQIDEQLACLELFHGPSHAFKDFGARFMSRLMQYLIQEEQQKLYILVATSGDTGGAVAQGFLGVEGIEVIILYPSQKISELQEKQLTTLGQNITALEINGTFDDCQRLVKKAFLDEELRSQIRLSSANSINIARLIPQVFYYVYAHAQAQKYGRNIVFSVPSGNFGNLTAGLIAAKMGMPVEKFVASNNANDVFTSYHQNGIFEARPSVKTYSNAMDVGNPSNLQRIQELFGNIEVIRNHIDAYSFTDEQTLEAMKEVYQKYNYVVCPHTAVAYSGLQSYFKNNKNSKAMCIFLGTAHPAKFLDIVEPALNIKLAIPENLSSLMHRDKEALLMDGDYGELKRFLLEIEKA